MNLSFKKNIFMARMNTKKAADKSKSIIKKNLKATINEISEDISPELAKVKNSLAKAALDLAPKSLK